MPIELKIREGNAYSRAIGLCEAAGILEEICV